MLLQFLIFMAIVSLSFSAFMYLHPVKCKLRITYAFIVVTLLSGILLLVNQPVYMVQICISGLFYISMVYVCMSSAESKLTGRVMTSNYKKYRALRDNNFLPARG